jgi:hypothetical protein
MPSCLPRDFVHAKKGEWSMYHANITIRRATGFGRSAHVVCAEGLLPGSDPPCPMQQDRRHASRLRMHLLAPGCNRT